MVSERQAPFSAHLDPSSFEASLCALAFGHLAEALKPARAGASNKVCYPLECPADHLLFGME